MITYPADRQVSFKVSLDQRAIGAIEDSLQRHRAHLAEIKTLGSLATINTTTGTRCTIVFHVEEVSQDAADSLSHLVVARALVDIGYTWATATVS